MLNLPYQDNSFDCLFAYHVISHTDTNGIKSIASEIKRVLRPDGEFYITLYSKETWSFAGANFPKIDENTIIKNDGGPEKDIPHYFVNLDDILILFNEFKIINIRHTDDCYWEDDVRNSKHFFILGHNHAV